MTVSESQCRYSHYCTGSDCCNYVVLTQCDFLLQIEMEDESCLSYRVDDISHGSAISAARLTPSEFREVFAERDREGDESLAGLKLVKLDTDTPRIRCPGCNARRSSYCYTCLDLLPGQSRPPLARLPFRFLIVTHQKEPRSRSTGVHAAVLAPKDVNLQTYRKGDNSCLPPSLFPDGRTVLLFPSGDAMTVSQLAGRQAELHATSTSYSRDPGDSGSELRQQVDDERFVIVVVDSTWSQARQIIGHPCIASLPRVAVGSYRTAFWRRQHLGENYLSTVEAVYYTCKEFDGPTYDGRYDNLLLFFVKCRNIVRERSGTVPCPSEASGGVCTKLQCQHSHRGDHGTVDGASELTGLGSK